MPTGQLDELVQDPTLLGPARAAVGQRLLPRNSLVPHRELHETGVTRHPARARLPRRYAEETL